MRRLISLSVIAVVLGLAAGQPVPAHADTVHDYTNVTIDPGCMLVPEGTEGAHIIDYTGPPSVGIGGSPSYPFDDTWTSGLFAPTPEDHANYFDRKWFQAISPGSVTYDLGAPFSEVYIALSQDHGPYPEEALEYRLEVSNDNVSYSPVPTDTPITMFRRGWSAAGETVACVGPFTEEPAGQGTGVGPNVDTANDDYSALWHLDSAYRYVRITAIEPTGPFHEPEIDALMGRAGMDGCTPGYWKQEQHFGSWTAPYDPADAFSNVFGRLIEVRTSGKTTVTDPTLLQALEANGGGINALARHAVAALLNAANPEVAYPLSTGEVIAMVQAAIDSGDYETAKDLLAADNERLCPLDRAELSS